MTVADLDQVLSGIYNAMTAMVADQAPPRDIPASTVPAQRVGYCALNCLTPLKHDDDRQK